MAAGKENDTNLETLSSNGLWKDWNERSLCRRRNSYVAKTCHIPKSSFEIFEKVVITSEQGEETTTTTTKTKEKRKGTKKKLALVHVKPLNLRYVQVCTQMRKLRFWRNLCELRNNRLEKRKEGEKKCQKKEMLS